MCHGRDWRIFEERRQKEAEERQAAQDRRGEVINALLTEAKERSDTDKPKTAPVKEVVTAT
jgi:hypothetical protein